MKSIKFLLIFTFSLLILNFAFFLPTELEGIFHSSNARAQTITQQINLTYPIPQLSNCRDAKECYFFCQIPQNQTICGQYAISHNLPSVLGVNSGQVLQAASTNINFPIPELGNCEDRQACREYCQIDENHDACKDFARRHKLQRAARRISFPIPELGNCEDRQACREFCADEANKQTCQEYARSHGLKIKKLVHSLIQNAKQELGCETLEQCKALCSEEQNQTSCRAFGLKHRQLNRTRNLERRDAVRDITSSEATGSALQDRLRERIQDRLNDVSPQTPTTTQQ